MKSDFCDDCGRSGLYRCAVDISVLGEHITSSSANEAFFPSAIETYPYIRPIWKYSRVNIVICCVQYRSIPVTMNLHRISRSSRSCRVMTKHSASWISLFSNTSIILRLGLHGYSLMYNLGFWDKMRLMLNIIQRFDKHYYCHLQGEYIMVEGFWKPYIGQRVGGELELMELIGGAKEQAAVKLETSTWMRKRDYEKNLFGTSWGVVRSFGDHLNRERISATMWPKTVLST